MTQEQLDKLRAESSWGWNLLDQAAMDNDLDLGAMTSYEALNAILGYEGIVGYTQVILKVIEVLGLMGMDSRTELELELAMAIMNERQIDQFSSGLEYLEKGISVEDMPESLFID